MNKPGLGEIRGSIAAGYKWNGQRFIWQACADCGKERWVAFVGGKPVSVRCHPCFMKLRGRRETGANNPGWHGGRRKCHGYIYILNREHPNADKTGLVPEHRMVAEKRLGRLLKTNEVTHHLNGIKDDNRPENLAVMARGGKRGHHGYLVSMAYQKRIRELEAQLSQLPGR